MSDRRELIEFVDELLLKRVEEARSEFQGSLLGSEQREASREKFATRLSQLTAFILRGEFPADGGNNGAADTSAGRKDIGN